MSQPIDLTAHGLLGVSRSTLAALRAALVRDGGEGAAAYLREAGYAGGEAVYASFRRWLEAQGVEEPEELELPEFERFASEYFAATGWGMLSVSSLNDAVAVLDSPNWGEADPTSQLDAPACHLTTGMLADLFGRVADQALAVLEVECRSAGAVRCRFLIGSAEVMEHVYDEMTRGVGYGAALDAVR